MINKEQVNNILRANGINPNAKDEEIRSVLLSARYNDDEVDAAVLVLRENTLTKKTHVDGLHKVLRSDQGLNSSEISALLGFDVDLSHRIKAGASANSTSVMTQTMLFFVAVILALGLAIAYMYVMQIGVFHPSTAIAQSFAE